MSLTNKVPRMGMTLASAMEGITDHPSKAMPQQLRLADIIVDQQIQVRVNGLSEDNLNRITAVLENGGVIDEPVIVYKTEHGLILADGFHRLEVHRRLNRPTILGVVRQGSYQDAADFAEDANLKHGQPLTNDDKKSLLFRRLERGHEWTTASFESIGKALGVSRDTVRRWFNEFSTRANAQVDRSKVLGADGKQRDMSKSIARNKAVAARSETPQDDDYLVGETSEFVRPPVQAINRHRLTDSQPSTPDTAFNRTPSPSLPARPPVATVSSGDLDVGIRRKAATESPALILLRAWDGSRALEACQVLDPDLRYELQTTLQDVAYAALERWAQMTQWAGYRDDGFVDSLRELFEHYGIIEKSE